MVKSGDKRGISWVLAVILLLVAVIFVLSAYYVSMQLGSCVNGSGCDEGSISSKLYCNESWSCLDNFTIQHLKTDCSVENLSGGGTTDCRGSASCRNRCKEDGNNRAKWVGCACPPVHKSVLIQKSVKIPVIVLKYFPVKDDGSLDTSETGDWQNPSLDALRAQVSDLNVRTIGVLEKGSAYHGYKDASAASYLDFDVVYEKEYLRQIAVSQQFTPFPDHIAELSSINICDWVENRGVKEVWIWMTHNSRVVPIESNMAGPNGDVSNSYRQPDLPVCSKTYTVYDYNYGRGVGEAVEDHTHQLESVFSFVDYAMWSRFESPFGETTQVNHCGWTHSPPNTKRGYDWANEADVLSDCEDWNPDGTGQSKVVDCHAWYGASCSDNGGVEFKQWWMQNIPGYNNNLTYNSKALRNWWEFIADFDAALESGKALTSS